MKKCRIESEWLSPVDEFEQSGLTQTGFCARRGFSVKYFSLRRMKLKARSKPGTFTTVLAG